MRGTTNPKFVNVTLRSGQSYVLNLKTLNPEEIQEKGSFRRLRLTSSQIIEVTDKKEDLIDAYDRAKEFFE